MFSYTFQAILAFKKTYKFLPNYIIRINKS